MKPKFLVAGIGNIFLGDDAFGVEVVKRLQARPPGDGVRIADFGIRSYDLAYALMEDWDLVILVDALSRGEAPGTLYTLDPQPPKSDEAPVSLDSHSMNPVAALQLVVALGGKVPRMLVVGCEPANLEPDADGKMGLSAPVSAAVNRAVAMIEELIRSACNQAIPA